MSSHYRKFNIVDGPSKLALAMQLLALGESNVTAEAVKFTIEPDTKLRGSALMHLRSDLFAWVQGMVIEDGSGESWTIKILVTHSTESAFMGCREMVIYYHSGSRTGYINIDNSSLTI